MTDLRARIAAVLTDELSRQQRAIDPKRHPRDPWRWQWFDMQAVADAVIAELGLQKQILHDGIIEYGEPHLWQHPCETRYVTDWTVDE